jgi:peroxiredoxin
LVAVVGLMLLAARSPRFGRGVGTQAPSFTLPTTANGSVSLSSFGGKDVLLYFSEGVGCDTCFYQMRDLEQNAEKLSADGLTVLPIVVNPADQVRTELDRFGLTTPFLIDADEHVSTAYGVIGTGMHENLPGHSFILVDGSGKIAWRGDYPSMFVTTDELLTDIGTDVAPR